MSCVSPLLVLSSSLQDNNHFPPTLPSTPPFPEHPTSPSRFFCAVRINRPSSLKIYQQLPVKMVIKRKRSESELSSFSSAFSSPTRPGSQSIDTLAIGQINWGALSSRSSTPNHLPSRTMKRFRDNRPSESEVHRESPNASHRPVKTLTRTPPPSERTLNLLYSAQQRQQHETPMVEIQTDISVDMSEAPATETPARHSNNQRSLHSFWALPSPTSSLGGSPPQTAATLHVEAEMDMELDIQMS